MREIFVGALRDALVFVMFLIVVAWALGRREQGFSGRPKKRSQGKGIPDPHRQVDHLKGRTARDPACGMFVWSELSYRLVQDDETLHICSQECLERYQEKLRDLRTRAQRSD